MNDADFNVLLDKYLGGDLDDPSERLALRQAIAESPRRRARFLRMRQLQLAFSEIPQRKPKVMFRFPSIARMHRFGAMFGNAAVFVFTLGLVFQNSDAIISDTVGHLEAPVKNVQNARPAETTHNPTASIFSFNNDSDSDVAPYSSEWMSATAAAADFASVIPVEEYGFVRL